MVTNVSEEHFASIFRVKVLYPEDRGDMFLRNISNHIEDCTHHNPEDYNPTEDLFSVQER
jgi:hypothetical protein